MLLQRGGHLVEVGAQPRDALGILQQGEHGVADEVDGRCTLPMMHLLAVAVSTILGPGAPTRVGECWKRENGTHAVKGLK